MTLPGVRRVVARRLAGMPGVRSVRRPVTAGGDRHFDLYWVRSGPPSARPLVVIPGGPGAASIQLYRGLRSAAAAAGLDVIMVEHRGVGLSRHDDSGADLPPAALTIEQVVDDIAAVLDDADVADAVIYGTSYGTYLAAGMGVRHPGRVSAMILDSPLLSSRDIDDVRRALRSLLWDGDHADGSGERDGDGSAATLARKVRALTDAGVLSSADSQRAATVYEYGGAPLLARQLDLLLRGRRLLWSLLGGIGRLAEERRAPFSNEADLVGPIGFRELNFGGVPDGLPLDPAVAMRQSGAATPPFEGEPFDLVEAMPGFAWPTAVISGGRDLTTPPVVARRVASLIPRAVLVELPTAGHSALDSRERAALRIAAAVVDGRGADLPSCAAELDALPGSTTVRVLVGAIDAATRLEGLLPSLPGRMRGVSA